MPPGLGVQVVATQRGAAAAAEQLSAALVVAQVSANLEATTAGRVIVRSLSRLGGTMTRSPPMNRLRPTPLVFTD
jgi:hypothetical protein